MSDSEAFKRRCDEHRRLSNKFAFISLGQMAETIRFENVVKHGGDTAGARRSLQHCVREAQALKQLAAEIGM